MKGEGITKQEIEEARKEVLASLAKYDELLKEYLESKSKDKATN